MSLKERFKRVLHEVISVLLTIGMLGGVPFCCYEVCTADQPPPENSVQATYVEYGNEFKQGETDTCRMVYVYEGPVSPDGKHWPNHRWCIGRFVRCDNGKRYDVQAPARTGWE